MWDIKTRKKTKKQSSKDGLVDKPKLKIPVSFKLQVSDLWENPELVLTKMASSSWVSKAGTWIPEFILAKFPYIQTLTLIMLMAERALKMEKYPPMHPYIIYTIAVVSLISGVMMSAKIQPRIAALAYSVVLAYLTINAYTNKQFNYSRHERNRISSRHLGCLGIYLIYAFIKGGRNSKLLQRLGELCVAVYLFGTVYLINESYEDKRAFMELVPGGNYARYFLTLVLICAAFCFISGYFLKDISMSVVFCLTFLTCLVDMKFSYWGYRGISYWNQVRLTVDQANLIAGFFMFISHYENLSKEEAARIETEETEMEEEVVEESTEDQHEKFE